MSFYCGRCGEFDATNTARSHRCATNKVGANATNSGVGHVPVAPVISDSVAAGQAGRGLADGGGENARTANRRTRKDYNEYQRLYMRKRRAKPATA